MKSEKHALHRQVRPPEPLELLCALSDGCMHLLSSNAWKVVSYIARQNIAAYAKKIDAANDPFKLLAADLGQMGVALPGSKTSDEGPHAHFEILSGGRIPKLLTTVSLGEISRRGMRLPSGNYQNRGTGLAKSSAVEAIKEAVESGILEHRRQQRQGRDVASLYGINWPKVFELAEALKKRQKLRKFGRPIGGQGPVQQADT